MDTSCSGVCLFHTLMHLRVTQTLVVISLLLKLHITSISARGGITPPPNIDNRPVISDDRIWFLNHIPEKCRPPLITKLTGGGIIRNSLALIKRDNPHEIKGNIQIAPSGCLYIEPGAVLKFAPGVGMIINGTLIARVSSHYFNVSSISHINYYKTNFL